MMRALQRKISSKNLPEACRPCASTRKPCALPHSFVLGVAMIFSTSADSFATMAAGRLAGAMTAFQLSTGSCGAPASAVVGTISCPPMRSVMAGAKPLKGTCWMPVFYRSLNNASFRWCGVP